MSTVESAPSATSLDVKTLLSFDSAAGVAGDGSSKGKVVLLEGDDFNVGTDTVLSVTSQLFARVKIASLENDEILDSGGNEVWGVITCSARTTAGTYVLRFYSGTYGDSCTPFTMNVGFNYLYSEIFDLADMPVWGNSGVFVDKAAAQLVAGQIGATELASGAVTTAKLATGAVTGDQIAGAAVTSGKIGTAAVGESKIQDSAVSGPNIASAAVSSDKLHADLKVRVGGGWDAISKLVGDASTTTFDLGHYDVDMDEEAVLVVADGIVLEKTEDYTFSDNTGTAGVDQIVFVSAPATGVRVAVRYRRISL